MTPARKAALQFFYDRGEVHLSEHVGWRPTSAMVIAMERDGQLQWRNSGLMLWSLTDKGRRMLHGDAE